MTPPILQTPPADAPDEPRVRRLRYEPLTGERTGPPIPPTPAAPALPAPTWTAVLSPGTGTRAAEPAVGAADAGATSAAMRCRRDVARGLPARGADDRLRPDVEAALRLVLEVLDGHRPAMQLTAQLTPAVLRCVRAAGRRGAGRSRLASLRIFRPTPGAAEVAAVYRLDGRARAVAARFEHPDRDDRRWRCVAIRLG
jgi:hypothetical protein